jgi:hypothetical protein
MLIEHMVDFVVARPRVEPVLHDALDLVRIRDSIHMALEAGIFSQFRPAHRMAQKWPLVVRSRDNQNWIRSAVEDSDRANQIVI